MTLKLRSSSVIQFKPDRERGVRGPELSKDELKAMLTEAFLRTAAMPTPKQGRRKS